MAEEHRFGGSGIFLNELPDTIEVIPILEHETRPGSGRRDGEQEARLNGWRPIIQKTEAFLLDQLPLEKSFPEFDLPTNPEMLDIFIRMVSPELVQKRIMEFDDGDLLLGHRTDGPGVHLIRTSTKKAYIKLAIEIRIIGLQNKPKADVKNPRTLRENIDEARTHFSEKAQVPAGAKGAPGMQELERWMSCFNFGEEYTDGISRNIESMLTSLGQIASADENPWDYCCLAKAIRKIPTKPEKIGLWLYQICLRLKNGTSFLLHFRLHRKLLGEASVSHVAKDWCGIMERFDAASAPNRTSGCILFMDGYYLEKESRKYLQEKGRRYFAFVNNRSCGPEIALLTYLEPVSGARFKAIYNEKTKEMFSYQPDKNANELKYRISNTFRHSILQQDIEDHEQNRTPYWSDYNHGFDLCDAFNKGTRGRMWPHKRGGRGLVGECGRVHDFAMSSILQNTFNLHSCLRGYDPRETSFADSCSALALHLYEYAMTL